jgi:hypothetical protein
MALHAGEDGELTLTLRMLANLVRDKRGRPIVKSTVENVLNDLEAMGAIEKDDLAMRVDYFTKGLEFENAPNITIDPQFRAVERRDRISPVGRRGPNVDFRRGRPTTRLPRSTCRTRSTPPRDRPRKDAEHRYCSPRARARTPYCVGT